MNKILVTGAAGRFGQALILHLRARHGSGQVIATDRAELDVLDKVTLLSIIQKNKIGSIYHLAAMLPAACEKQREKGWNTNIEGLLHVLDAAKLFGCKVFWSSSIAALGLQHPTVYGMSKAAGENWCAYYQQTFGVDVRAIRYPGIYVPGATARGGLMDLINEASHCARTGETYISYLKPQTTVPAIHIADAVRAAGELMAAERQRLQTDAAYNIRGFSFNAAEVLALLQKSYPDFTMKYKTDQRQVLAESWPQDLNDKPAAQDWGWKAAYQTLEQCYEPLPQY